MSLSNTATPRYYAEFRDKVLRQEIPVCEEIEAEMNRIDKLVANRNVYYDDEAVEGFVLFCEGELTKADGGDLNLLDTFKLWAEQIFAWWIFREEQVFEEATPLKRGGWVVRTVKRRLTEIQYLIVARGAAKSMYVSCLQNYFLNVDTDRTHQVATAPTMKQAEEVLSPMRTSILKARGPVFKFLTLGSLQNTTGPRSDRQKLVATKKGIENFLTGSICEIRPMTVDKLQGLGTKFASVDEWLSGDVRENVIGALTQGGSKVPDSLIVAVSSEGTVRNGVGDSIKMELMAILRGEGPPAPHISIFHYKLDKLEEVEDSTKWLKANPNLGKTVTYEAYLQDVEKAERSPSTRNDTLAKRFGWPSEGYTFFFTYEETIPHRSQKFWQQPCSLGADLSQGDDFCAFTFLFPFKTGAFGVKTRSYITRLTLDKLQPSMWEKYQDFLREGSLVVMEGKILEMMDVYDDLEDLIEANEYDVRTFGYDPYNAKEFVERWIASYGEWGIEKVIQGARTESVPLGELKILAEQRMLIFDQQLMKFAMGNAITLEDTNGNRKLWKLRQDEKIDNVSAMLDAYVAWKAHKEMHD